MSPKAVCRKCGEVHVFHEIEIDSVEAGEVFCVDCSLSDEYDVFLGEVLGGEHPELMEHLRERLKDEEE